MTNLRRGLSTYLIIDDDPGPGPLPNLDRYPELAANWSRLAKIKNLRRCPKSQRSLARQARKGMLICFSTPRMHEDALIESDAKDVRWDEYYVLQTNTFACASPDGERHDITFDLRRNDTKDTP